MIADEIPTSPDAEQGNTLAGAANDNDAGTGMLHDVRFVFGTGRKDKAAKAVRIFHDIGTSRAR